MINTQAQTFDDNASLKGGYAESTTTLVNSLPPGKDLPALSAPLGIYPQYITKEPMQLNMKKELSWSLADFDIKRGDELYGRVDSKFRLSYEKFLKSPSGELLMTLTTSMWSWTRKTIGTTPDGSQVLEIKRVNNRKLFTSPTLIATFKDFETGEERQVEVEAKVYKNTASLTSNGEVVGTVMTPHSVKSERVVSIAPNADWVLLMAICICFDMHVMELTGTHGGFKGSSKDPAAGLVPEGDGAAAAAAEKEKGL